MPKKFIKDYEIELALKMYYEKPRKKISADIPYDIYVRLKNKSKDMSIPMSKLIIMAFIDIIKKYNIVDKQGQCLSEVLFIDDDMVMIDNGSHYQLLLND